MRRNFDTMKIFKIGRAQIWVETVVYTLIGIVLIGVVLAIITPKINETKDRLVIEQTIETLGVLDDKILETLDWGENNVRIAELTMKKGKLLIEPQNEIILFILGELKKPYSEIGVQIDYGRVKIISEIDGRENLVKVFLNYTGIANITYNGEETEKEFGSASVPYKFFITNKPNNSTSNDLLQIDIVEGMRN